MPIEHVDDTGVFYYLTAFDKNGNERTDDPDGGQGRLSEVVAGELSSGAYTDVVLISHGWKGDVPAAKRQYDSWIRAMLTCADDRQRAHDRLGGFAPLIVGFHWPSLPWGDESLEDGGVSFAADGTDYISALIRHYAENLVDRDEDLPRAEAAVKTIFESAAKDIQPSEIPQQVTDAYALLNQLAGLGWGGVSAPPGSDGEPFDAERAYRLAGASDAVSYGTPTLGGLLAPLRQLSFWKMKKRACVVGESGGASLVSGLQEACGSHVRFHLMGHSFGCIVVSAILAGGSDRTVPRPVASVYLVQGALSIWSYCSRIPRTADESGYFNCIVAGDRVTGPFLTTRSIHDTAVGRLYPFAAGIKRQIVYDPSSYPKYGALGEYGARGPAVEAADCGMLPLRSAYQFLGGHFYNLEASQYICEGGGLSGAHSDISRPEVAHAFWSAMLWDAPA